MRGMVRPGDCVFTSYTVKEIDGNKVTFDWEQYSKMPLAILKDGEVVQTFEAEDRSWYDVAKDTVKEVEITGGDPSLLDAAKNAFLQWQYTPFMNCGQPVEMRSMEHVKFSAP